MQRAKAKVDQAEVVRTIGERFREARELCNMSQQRAAEALGYANSSKLAKIEGATDTNSVPLHLIPKAARLYDVSTDFLFGLTTDWERDGGALEDRESFGYLQAKRDEDRRRDEENFGRLSGQMRSVAKAIADIGPLVELLTSGVGRVAMDAAFEGIRGGATVLSAAERIAVAYKGALLSFKKTKLDMEGWKEEPLRGFPEAVAAMAQMNFVERTHAIRQAAKVYRLPVGVVHQVVELEVRTKQLIDGKARQLEMAV